MLRFAAVSAVCAWLLLAAPCSSFAQIDYQPTPAPVTAAIDRDWYRSDAPIPFAGDVYYPSGPTVYFNGNSMIETGEYDGVILYADTTVEPYSMVLVPVTDDILRPYVRVRPDEQLGSERVLLSQPTQTRRQAWPSGRGPADRDIQSGPAWAAPGQREYREQPFDMPSAAYRLETVRKPEGNLGIWIAFQGRRWQQVGDAVSLDPGRLVPVGDYAGFAVYADPHEPYIIYLPTRANLVAPFRRTEK